MPLACDYRTGVYTQKTCSVGPIKDYTLSWIQSKKWFLSLKDCLVFRFILAVAGVNSLQCGLYILYGQAWSYNLCLLEMVLLLIITLCDAVSDRTTQLDFNVHFLNYTLFWVTRSFLLTASVTVLWILLTLPPGYYGSESYLEINILLLVTLEVISFVMDMYYVYMELKALSRPRKTYYLLNI